jgi:hypothetical protein
LVLSTVLIESGRTLRRFGFSMSFGFALACAACTGEISGVGGTSGADEPNLATPDPGEGSPADGDPESDATSDEPDSAPSVDPVADEPESAASDPSGPAAEQDEAPTPLPSDGVDETGTVADAYRWADLSELHVESGVIEVGPDDLALRSSTVRATLGAKPRSALELSFLFRGDSAETAPLASGELRQQLGIKLRAQNTCNVVYVMWHIAPSTGIHVSVKSNPGQSQHAECVDNGYLQLSPSFTRAVAPIEAGQPRSLEARIEGTTLRVSVDGSVVWDGPLPATAFEFDGPVGLRSDNGDFDVGLRVQG